MAPMPPTYNAHAPQQTHDGLVVDVFKHNFMQAFDQMCHLVLTHKYIAMDTEFPGVVARPIGEFPTQQAFQYQQVRVNVNLLKLIQLGLTFFDENGNIPPTGPSTFQFNFQFDKASDMFSQESIQLLEKSGIPFHQLKEDGIPHSLFAEAFLSSGIVLTDDVTILSFHSSYDFGYLLRLLQAQYLPEKEAKFMSLLEQYFKNIYDIKFLMKSCKSLNGGLEDISKTLEIPRVGQQHQAGSDSLLTGKCFFAMRDQFFEGELERSRHGGRLFGITEHYGKQSNDDEATESYSSQPQSVDSIDFMRD